MINAYTNFNLGDDLFIKILSERYPNTRFFLYAPKKYNLYFKESKNIKIIPNDSIFNRGVNFIFRFLKIQMSIKKLVSKSCDAIVNIGGSIFMQGENWKETFESNKSMRAKNKPFFVLGANFGPYSESEFYLNYKELFQEYTDICFREKKSFELFNDLNNVRWADDIVFQIQKQAIEQAVNNIVVSVIKPSIRKHLSKYDDIYYSKIKEIALLFIEKGYNVTLMSFCDNEGDREAIDEIINLIPNEFLSKVSKHLYELNIEETLNIIASSKFIVATRFHSMILGWVYNKPVFPIVYSEKMTNVMEDLGFQGLYTKINNIEFLKPEEVFQCMKTNRIDVSMQVKSAEKHFEKLDEFLVNKKR
jgi:colanic acid/amylovoran biosynthesis protein